MASDKHFVFGHQITCHGRMADPDRANALQTWPAPANRSELRSLLGTFGFWRTYIKNYAAIVSCMTALTSDKIPWNWTYEHEKALLDLKTALRESPVLMAPRSDLPFVLVTDASEFAIGACLECVVSDGVRRPVAFLSHALSPAERKYPVYEKELLAMIIALRTWRHHLQGSEFSVYCNTDHKTLQHFMSHDQDRGMLVRWQQFLSTFNLQINHIPGKENVIANALSRRPDPRCLLLATAASSDLDPSTRRILKAQKRDKFCQRKLQEARNPKIQSSWRELSGILVNIRILTSTHDDRITIYVPESLRSVILKEFHDSALAGHCGWKKVFHALQQWYCWETMEKDVKAFVQACPHCQWYKLTIQPVPPIIPKLVPQRPFSEISLDWVGPLPVSTQQHDSLLNIFDSFTKYAICIPVTRSMTTKQLINTLWARLFTNVGLPMKIIGDRDTRLTADAMRALCK
jgi:hypothetical protein